MMIYKIIRSSLVRPGGFPNNFVWSPAGLKPRAHFLKLRYVEMINQKFEKQKGKTAYEKKYRKQIKTKLLKIKKLYRG